MLLNFVVIILNNIIFLKNISAGTCKCFATQDNLKYNILLSDLRNIGILLSTMNFSEKQVSLFFRSKKGSWELVMEIENLFIFDGSRKENYIFTFKGSLL